MKYGSLHMDFKIDVLRSPKSKSRILAQKVISIFIWYQILFSHFHLRDLKQTVSLNLFENPSSCFWMKFLRWNFFFLSAFFSKKNAFKQINRQQVFGVMWISEIHFGVSGMYTCNTPSRQKQKIITMLLVSSLRKPCVPDIYHRAKQSQQKKLSVLSQLLLYASYANEEKTYEKSVLNCKYIYFELIF